MTGDPAPGAGGTSLALVAGSSSGGGAVVIGGAVLLYERRRPKAKPKPVQADTDLLGSVADKPDPTRTGAGPRPARPSPEDSSTLAQDTPASRVADERIGEAPPEVASAPGSVIQPPVSRAAWPPPPAAASTAPLPVPEPTANPLLVIRMLGRVDIEGLRRSIRRRQVIRLLILLALADGKPVDSDQLCNLMVNNPDRGELSLPTLHKYAADLRAALPEGLLPAWNPAGYQLDVSHVEIDWHHFETLDQQARQSADANARVDLGCRALRLVRGRPLDNYRWTAVDQRGFEQEATIADLAVFTAETALELHRPHEAEQACQAAVRAYKQRIDLWALRLRAAAAGSGQALPQVWTAASGALEEARNELRDIYRDLGGDPDRD